MSSTNVKKTGFTLIELLIVIAIIAILAAILFPVFSRARETARKTSCLSNLRQISLGLMQYTQDYDEFLPSNDNGPDWAHTPMCWIDMLRPYIKGDQIFVCPSATLTDTNRILQIATKPHYTYAINNVYRSATEVLFEKGKQASIATIEDTPGTIFCGDSQPGATLPSYGFQVIGDTYFATTPATFGETSGSQGQFVARHMDGANFAFFDGHAKWLSFTKVRERNAANTRCRYFTKALD